MRIHRCRLDDAEFVVASGHLFDELPTIDRSRSFLQRAGNHLLIALIDESPAGFVSGVEVGHPDKPTEMLLYELGVDASQRRKGVGRALVEGLRDLAEEVGCAGMWVPIEPGNEAALATYRSAGADGAEDAVIMTWDWGR